MMKNRFLTAILVGMMFCFLTSAVFAQDKKPVILDADMVELFDDGMAMLMLARSEEVELLGVTVVIGNTWVEDGTASALRQLEGIGKEKEIPVYMGRNRTTRSGRFAALQAEQMLFGRGADSYLGAAGYAQPASWQDAYAAKFHRRPQSVPAADDAVDFIIRTVKARPHDVTVVAIGTAANLAAALQKAPEIAPLVKQVCYMGGAFFVGGNVMPAAEFNFWLDPEAARTALRAPFGEQVIVPLDVCEKVHITQTQFREISARLHNPVFADMWQHHWMYPLLRDGAAFNNYVWDVIAAAIVIDPSLILEEEKCFVDINDTYSPSYGQSLAYRGAAPAGTQAARIIKTVDEKRLWQMIYRVCDEL